MLAPFSVIAAKSEKTKPIQPNIIFIYSDDQRQDAFRVSGNRIISTPELDKMASQGVCFTNANVVFALYSPSRLALLIGHYGSVNRVLELDSDLKTVRNKTQANVYGYPDAVAIQNHTSNYYSVITETDDFLAKLFITIDELGLLENTYPFFMSDNGWILGDHGFTSKVFFRELSDQNEDPEELNNLVIDENRKKIIQHTEAEIREHTNRIL